MTSSLVGSEMCIRDSYYSPLIPYFDDDTLWSFMFEVYYDFSGGRAHYAKGVIPMALELSLIHI
eukprot:7623757-Prorocentrum_lima.AAC.1